MADSATATPEPVRITIHRIPSGSRGTDRTVQHIRSLILQGSKDFAVRRRAISIMVARGVRPKDYRGEIEALFQWVQRNIRYTRDPYRVELLHSARRMLDLRAGDCDDMTILLGAMLQSIGHPVRILLTGPDAVRPGLFTHVYPEVRHRGRWIALDATMPHPMGWAPQTPVKKVIPLRPLRKGPAMRFAGVDDTLGQLPIGVDAGLVTAVRGPGVQPRDPRVKAVWDQLRSRGLLDRDPWVRWVLRRLWDTGLASGYRPRTAARLEAALRGFGMSAAADVVPASALTCYVAPDGQLVAPALGPGGRAWLRELLTAVDKGTLAARDPRVSALWRLLRGRVGTGTESPAHQLLLELWRGGGSTAGPATATRLAALLTETGLLPQTRRTSRRPGYRPVRHTSYTRDAMPRRQSWYRPLRMR